MLPVLMFVLFAGAFASPVSNADPFWIDGALCGTSKYPDAGELPATTIVGGREARVNEFPYQVTLLYQGGFTCGGVIMDENWVLTAAHCVHNRESPASDFTVVVGNHDINLIDTTERAITVSQVIKHVDYAPILTQNDIALLRLSTPLTLDQNIAAACAPDAATDYTGMMCTVSGWGSLQYEPQVMPEILQYVNLPITDQVACKDRYAKLSADMICAGDPFESQYDACQGDSGGPLTCKVGGKFYLVGLVSWGEGCASGKPGVYTRVQYFLDWITANAP